MSYPSNLVAKSEYTGFEKLYIGNGLRLLYITLVLAYLHLKLIQKDCFSLKTCDMFQKWLNLLNILKFTKDNNAYFEFHPHHYAVKENETNRVLL